MTEEAIEALHTYVARKKEQAQRIKEVQETEKARQLRQQTLEALDNWRVPEWDAKAKVLALLAPDDPGTGPLKLVRGVEFWHKGGYYETWQVRVAGYVNTGQDPLELLAQVYAHLDAQAEKVERDREVKLANFRYQLEGDYLNFWPHEAETIIKQVKKMLLVSTLDSIPDDWSALFQEARQRAEDYQREREETQRQEEERREAEFQAARQEELEYRRKRNLRERALWYPFRVWRVEYTSIDEDGPCSEFFYALSPTPVEHRGTPGWFTDISGRWVQVPNPVRVVEVDVAEPNYSAMVHHPVFGVWMPPERAEVLPVDTGDVRPVVTLSLETCQVENRRGEMGEPERYGENWHWHAAGLMYRWIPEEWLKETEEEAG